MSGELAGRGVPCWPWSCCFWALTICAHWWPPPDLPAVPPKNTEPSGLDRKHCPVAPAKCICLRDCIWVSLGCQTSEYSASLLRDDREGGGLSSNGHQAWKLLQRKCLCSVLCFLGCKLGTIGSFSQDFSEVQRRNHTCNCLMHIRCLVNVPRI